MKLLPLGSQTFEGLIKGEYVYVDKTMYLYSLIQPGMNDRLAAGPKYFLSRPRRFGKSLTVTTLEALFLGKKELFRGLWIDQNTDYAFPVHPVIRLDMSELEKESPQHIEASLSYHLQEIARKYQVSIPKAGLSTQFSALITAMSKTEKVVVLIDEYDAPLVKYITEPEKAKLNRDVLKEFYGILKSQDANLRFVFLTGVTKFSKVSVFSGLNHLQDLSMDKRYAALCGYTQEELEHSFSEYIEAMAQDLGISKEETLDKLKYWYNGYRMSEAPIKVYNPFSTLNALSQKRFVFKWFESGTPRLLLDILQEREFSIERLENITLTEEGFSATDIDAMEIETLLVQTGYLTIKHYDNARNLYELGYPNYEVENGMITALAERFGCISQGTSGSLAWKLVDALEEANTEAFFEYLNLFFAKIPYDLHLQYERYYQSLFHAIFTLLSMKIQSEVHTHKGRIDTLIDTKKAIWIFEFKLDRNEGTEAEQTQIAQSALDQIETKGYAKAYQDKGKPIYLIGVAFDWKERLVGRFLQKNLSHTL